MDRVSKQVSLIRSMYTASWSFHEDLQRERDLKMSIRAIGKCCKTISSSKNKKTPAVRPRNTPTKRNTLSGQTYTCPDRNSDHKQTNTTANSTSDLIWMTWAIEPTNLLVLLRFMRTELNTPNRSLPRRLFYLWSMTKVQNSITSHQEFQ